MGAFPRSGMAVGLVGGVVAALGMVACNGNGTAPDPTGEIVVSVTADGAAASGIAVTVFPSGGSAAVGSGTTGGDGRVAIGNLAAGSYDVEVAVPAGMTGTARRNVSVAGGATATVSFTLTTQEDPGDPGDGEDEEVVIQLLEATFSPADVTVEPGTTVRWVNSATIFHTITPDGHSEWERQEMHNEGDTFEHTFNTAGEFEYFCEPHAPGMRGIIRVESSS